MNNNGKIHPIVKQLDLSGIVRIDYSMEGDWNANLAVLWERGKGVLNYSNINKSHSTHKPTIELYFDGYWVGLHCYKTLEDKNVFDEDFALSIMKYIEGQL